MSTVESAVVLAPVLLDRLSLALQASEPERAVRDALSGARLPAAKRDAVLEQVLLVARRARQRDLCLSSAEVKLSLGVVLVLCGAHGPVEAGS